MASKKLCYAQDYFKEIRCTILPFGDLKEYQMTASEHKRLNFRKNYFCGMWHRP